MIGKDDRGFLLDVNGLPVTMKILLVGSVKPLGARLKKLFEDEKTSLQFSEESDSEAVLAACVSGEYDMILFSDDYDEETITECANSIDSHKLLPGLVVLSLKNEEACSNNEISFLPNEVVCLSFAGLMEAMKHLVQLKRVEVIGVEQDRILDALFDSAPLMLLMVDGNRVVRRANAYLYRYLKSSPDKVLGRKIGEVFKCYGVGGSNGGDFESKECNECFLLRLLDRCFQVDVRDGRKRKPFIETNALNTSDPELKDKNYSATSIPISILGEPMAMICLNDITQRREFENALRESEERLRSTLSSMTDLVFVLDVNGNFLDYMQPRLEDELHVPSIEFLGKNVKDVLPDVLASQTMKAVSKVLETSDVVKLDYSLETPKGLRWYSAMLSPRRDYQEEIKGVTVVSRDITDLKQAEAELLLKEERLSTILDAVPDIIYEMEKDGKIVYVNKAAKNKLGWPLDKLGDLKISDFLPEEELEKLRKSIARLYEKKDLVVTDIIKTQSANGDEIPIESSSRLLLRDGYQTILGVARDIRERQYSENLLQESEEKFRALAENSYDTIMRFDRQHRHLYVNPIVEKQTGISPDKFIGKTHAELGFPHHLVELWDDAIDKVFKKGSSNRIEFSLPTGIWIDWWMIPELDLDGSVKAVITSARDITEIKKAQEVLAASEKRFRSLVDKVAEAVVVFNSEGVICFVNPAVKEIFGQNPEDLIGKFIGSIDEIDKEKLVDSLSKGKKRPQVEIRSVDTQWEGEGAKLISIRDVSERERVEELHRMLEAEKLVSDRMRELDHMKNEFVQTVTHELRTPVTILSSAVQQLVDGAFGDFSPTQREFLEMMERNISRLTRFATGVLALSKLDSGMYSFNARPFKLYDALRPELEMIKTKAEEKGVSITFKGNEELFAFADADAVCQVVTNLVNNAIMHNDEGTVIQIASKYNENKFIQISVTDNGKGIAREQLDRIFDRFYQSGRKSGAGYKGLGLGLALSKDLVERMGGRIWAESEIEKGTSFKFVLPSIILKQGIVFGKIALAMNYISKAQLLDVSKELQENGGLDKIGEIFIKKEYLTPEERDEILQVQAEMYKKPHPLSRSLPVSEMFLGYMARKKGFINEDQLKHCLKDQQIAFESGLEIKLGEVMLKKGYLSNKELQEILSIQKNYSLS